MGAMRRGLVLVYFVLALTSGCAESAVAQAPLAVTTVQDTVYSANGSPASGTVLVSWSGFTTATGAVVPAGSTSATIAAGGALSIALAPNAGATPMGSYYTATFHLSDGTTSREFWVIPATVAGGGPVRLAGIQNTVLPTRVAMQTVSKTYVDMAIAAAVTGHPADASSVYVLKAGDAMSGPLVLPGDPVSANQAADKNYVDESVTAIASGTISAARLPVFGPSGTTHAAGVVPDPGAITGATRFLREDGSWSLPASAATSDLSTWSPTTGCSIQYCGSGALHSAPWTPSRNVTLNSWVLALPYAPTGCTTNGSFQLKQGSTTLASITLANGTASYTANGFPMNITAAGGALSIQGNVLAADCSQYPPQEMHTVEFQMQ